MYICHIGLRARAYVCVPPSEIFAIFGITLAKFVRPVSATDEPDRR